MRAERALGGLENVPAPGESLPVRRKRRRGRDERRIREPGKRILRGPLRWAKERMRKEHGNKGQEGSTQFPAKRACRGSSTVAMNLKETFARIRQETIAGWSVRRRRDGVGGCDHFVALSAKAWGGGKGPFATFAGQSPETTGEGAKRLQGPEATRGH